MDKNWRRAKIGVTYQNIKSAMWTSTFRSVHKSLLTVLVAASSADIICQYLIINFYIYNKFKLQIFSFSNV